MNVRLVSVSLLGFTLLLAADCSSSSCPAPSTECDKVCVNTKNDNLNCGTCGTKCDAGMVCSAGVCAVSCLTSEVQCAARCIDPQTDYSWCGAKGVCSSGDPASADYQGAACASGMVCSAGVCATSCLGTQVLCGGLCVNPQTDRDYCGAKGACSSADPASADYQGKTCASYAACYDAVCIVAYGNTTPLPVNRGLAPDYLLGLAINVDSPILLIDFGVIAVGGNHIQMALYTDNAGHPGTLVASTASTTIVAGNMVIPAVSSVSLSVGTYWLMAVFDVTSYVKGQTGTSNNFDYVSLTYGSALPTTITTPGTQSGTRWSYYIVGLQ